MAREQRAADTDFLRRMGIVVDDGAPMLEDSERVQELEAKVASLTRDLQSLRNERDRYREQGMQVQKDLYELRSTVADKIREAIEMYKATVMRDGTVAPNVSPVPATPSRPSLHDLITTTRTSRRRTNWDTGVLTDSTGRWDTGQAPTYQSLHDLAQHEDIEEELMDEDDEYELPCEHCDDYSEFEARDMGASKACRNCVYG